MTTHKPGKLSAKEIFKITSIPVLLASLCCVSPLVLFFLGLGSATVAGSLADVLYDQYKWWFRAVGLLSLALALVFYFRKKGICTLDQAKRRRNEVMNIILIALTVSILAYIIWLYGIVHIVGVWAGLWGLIP
jgi:hypothetical protein